MAGNCILDEQLTTAQIKNVLMADEFCSLTTCSENTPSISSYFYGFSYVKGELRIYLDIINSNIEFTNITENPKVSLLFENRTIDSNNLNSIIYDTVIANGEVRIIKNYNESKCLRNKIMCRNSLNKTGVKCISEENSTTIIEVIVKETTGIRNIFNLAN